MRIKFNVGPAKLQVVKAVKECLNLCLKEAKNMVDEGVVECPRDMYNEVINALKFAGASDFQQLGGDDSDDLSPTPVYRDGRSPIEKCTIDEARPFIHVTSHQEITKWMADIVEKYRSTILNEIRHVIPYVVDFQILIEKNGIDVVRCAALTVETSAQHNSIDEINRISELTTGINNVILSSLMRDPYLMDIRKKMEPYIKNE